MELIEVEYEELPAVFEPLEALEPDAPKIHDGGNIAYEVHKEYGNVEEGFVKADYIFEDRYVTSKQAHCCVENRGCIAYFTAKALLDENPNPIEEEIKEYMNGNLCRCTGYKMIAESITAAAKNIKE